MPNFIHKMLSSGDEVSVKRVIGVMSFIAFMLSFFVIITAGKELPNQELIKNSQEVCWFIIACAFFAGAAEKIMAMRKGSQPPVDTLPQAPPEEGNVQ